MTSAVETNRISGSHLSWYIPTRRIEAVSAVAFLLCRLYGRKKFSQQPMPDRSLNTFGRNEIEVAPISSALLRNACLVILYKTCRVPDQELAADGVSGPICGPRARLLKQNENRRDGAATGPWSYLVVRSVWFGSSAPTAFASCAVCRRCCMSADATVLYHAVGHPLG